MDTGSEGVDISLHMAHLHSHIYYTMQTSCTHKDSYCI